MKIGCKICDHTGFVCEVHRGRPFKGFSTRADACDCSAGVPCGCIDDETTTEELAEAAGLEVVPPRDKLN